MINSYKKSMFLTSCFFLASGSLCLVAAADSLALSKRPVKQVIVADSPLESARKIYLFAQEYTLAPDIQKLFEGWEPQDVATLLSYLYQSADSPAEVEGLIRNLSLHNGRFLVTMLEAMQIDINQQDTDGTTPLIRAALIGDEAIIAQLVSDKRVNVNVQDGSKNSALMYAAFFGHIGCVKLLLAHPDCDKTLKNNQGFTAHELAELNNQTRCLELFA